MYSSFGGPAGGFGVHGYSYGALAAAADSSSHSREPSTSRRSSVPHPSHPPSIRSRHKNSTDEHHSGTGMTSCAHTRDSSYVGGTSSGNEDGLRSYRKNSSEIRRSVEVDHSSNEQRSHSRHAHHTHHAHHPHQHRPHHSHQRGATQPKAENLRQQSAEKPSKGPVHEETNKKVVIVKSKKKDSNSVIWRRISQGMGLGKPKEDDEPEPEVSPPAEAKTGQKSKWKWWGKKKEPSDDLEKGHGHQKPKAITTSGIKESRMKPRPGERSSAHQLPPAASLKQIFESDT
ncbi:hypothetical protein FZEAL_2290 [Fusarium zealandicum]|uniref:Uncharacterized protein n=1 Tax=Fusarium zealandicum TaxID=1053134 RepID=A0A8H4UR69_9HYPO|nr:hypothetical protein FZEAL_2290 [Fusarium zealandicum]